MSEDEKKVSKQEEDMLPEYHFDYSKAKPNRFANTVAENSMVVVLKPELARVFKTPERVTAILEAIAHAILPPEPPVAH